MEQRPSPIFILVHDAWLGAWCWEKVIEHLNQRDIQAVALDLPGHGAKFQPETAPGFYSLKTYAEAVVDFVRQISPKDPKNKPILVGHGTAGPVIQLAAEQLDNEVSGLVFMSAYILNNGETIAGQMPEEMALVLKELAGMQPDRRIPMEKLLDYWSFNVMSDDVRRAEEILKKLQPEPLDPLFEAVQLETFFKNPKPLPRAFISFNEDMSLPPGEFYPRMAGKLSPCRHLGINAGHQAPLTKPREIAEALIFLGLHGLH